MLLVLGLISLRSFPKHILFSTLKAEVDAKIARRAQLKTVKQTNVSSINKQGERRSQRSSNRRNKTVLRQRVDGKIVEGRSYEPTEWRKLTENQQKVVKDLRRKRGQSGKPHSAGKAVKLVRFNNEIESMLGQTLIARIDAIKKKAREVVLAQTRKRKELDLVPVDLKEQ